MVTHTDVVNIAAKYNQLQANIGESIKNIEKYKAEEQQVLKKIELLESELKELTKVKEHKEQLAEQANNEELLLLEELYRESELFDWLKEGSKEYDKIEYKNELTVMGADLEHVNSNME